MKRTDIITGKFNLLTATCLQNVLHRVYFQIDCFSKEFAIDAATVIGYRTFYVA